MKLTRKFMSIILTVMLVLSCVPMSAISVSAEEFADLTATIDTGAKITLKDTNSDGYYEISNADELFAFAEIVNGGNNEINAILTADITVNEDTMTDNSTDARVWTPIGHKTVAYNAKFNGNDKTISGLYFNDSEAENVGLFGLIYPQSRIDNVAILNSYFNGKSKVGGVVGYSVGPINNCTFSGIVSGTSEVGGIVGYFYYSSMYNCHNTGTVVGADWVGGVFGNSYLASIKNCTNSGTVTGTKYGTGGIAGNLAETAIRNSYNTGNVNGVSCVGGIVGGHPDSIIVTENCYNTGNISGYMYIGGIIGGVYITSTRNCYYLDTTCTSGVGSEDIYHTAEAKTAEQFKNGEVAYLLGKNYGQEIGIDELPVLGGKLVYAVKKCTGEIVRYSHTNEIIHGSIDENGICIACGHTYEPAVDSDDDGYYEIDNAGKLYWFANEVNSGNNEINAILTANITVNEGTITAESTNARVWTPIGNDNNYYQGIFEGNNKTISGLYFNNNNIDSVGLFGYAGEKSKIKNVTAENSYLNGYNYVGSIAGYNLGSVINCHSLGNTNGLYYVGGVVGYNNGTVSDCSNQGTINGECDYVGGIVGDNGNTITNSYNTGTVNGIEYVGGIAGHSGFGTITNCYNKGEVHGTRYIGGINGINHGTITNCYNTGNVDGIDYFVGGVVGNNMNIVTNCYNTGSVSGLEDIGGIVGINESIIRHCYNSGSVNGNDELGGIVGINYTEETDYLETTNCYYLNTACTGGINGEDIAGSAEAKTAEQFASGEVAYILGEAFGQTIGTDKFPVLGGKKVYRNVTCQGVFTGYSNTIENNGHIHETIKGYNATCTESGLTDGVKCSVCGEIITEQKVIPAKGHTHETTKGYDATCTESGLTDGVKCSVCGEIITEQIVIPAKGHNYNSDGYCTDCGAKAPIQDDVKDNKLYFKPSSNWKNDGARFVAYVWSGDTNKFIDLYDADGDGYYEFINDNNWQNIIFCRLSSSSSNDWNNIWNQTNDLVIATDGNNCYTLAEGSWSNGNGTWSKYNAPAYNEPNNNTLYFKPSSNWKNDSARFVVYVWSGDTNKWIDLYDTDSDGYYEFVNDNNWQNIIFCRLSSSAQTSWDNVWNQTNDLVIPTDGNNCYTLAEGSWSNGNGTWSKYGTPVTYDMGDIDLDGSITIRDASLLAKHLVACETLTNTQLKIADVNGDGYININDVTYIQKMLVELV